MGSAGWNFTSTGLYARWIFTPPEYPRGEFYANQSIKFSQKWPKESHWIWKLNGRGSTSRWFPGKFRAHILTVPLYFATLPGAPGVYNQQAGGGSCSSGASRLLLDLKPCQKYSNRPRIPKWVTVRCYTSCQHFFFNNTLGSRQNGRHFADDIFKYIFLNENFQISIKISQSLLLWVPSTIFQHWFR